MQTVQAQKEKGGEEMIQVELFCSQYLDSLQNALNEFLPTVKKLVDIKFSTSDNFREAMVIYETEAAE